MDMVPKIQALNLDSKISKPPFEVTGNSEYIYSLLNSAATDEETKTQLQHTRLKYVLKQFLDERNDTSFSRVCLFCPKTFTGNRSNLFDHLMEQHNFSVGAPDNIVFVNELMDHLEKLLKNLQCLYCEKIFKDSVTLKEHMRKKEHKRINPDNKTYDRFYLINYLESGKTWIQIQQEVDGSYKNYFETDLMDLDDESNVYICLFCENKFDDFDNTFSHMRNEHRFDFKVLKQKHRLDFYKQIKLINYIRKKMHEKECMICNQKFIVLDDLMCHMTETGHIAMFPDPSNWDQTVYFFSTFENDSLLCGLDVGDSDLQEYVVLPEDTAVPNTTLTNEELME